MSKFALNLLIRPLAMPTKDAKNREALNFAGKIDLLV
jgi:hypothetical protein